MIISIQFDVGFGPVTLSYGSGNLLYRNLRKNALSLGFNGIGFIDFLAFDGEVKFHKTDWAIEFTGGKIMRNISEITGLSGWAGAYNILGRSSPTGPDLRHELVHIWQSRLYGNHYIPLWVLSGLQSLMAGQHFNRFDGSYNTFNFFEIHAN